MSALDRAGARRIVTFNDAQGRSAKFANDRAPRAIDFSETKGMRASVLWATAETPLVDGSVSDPIPDLASCHPTPGGSVFMTLTVPPASVFESPEFNPERAMAEQLSVMPGIVERMEADAPGFHKTESVDYFILLSGELWLVLDRDEVKLSPGDVVIQNGTRHAWQNRSEEPATFAVVLLGMRT